MDFEPLTPAALKTFDELYPRIMALVQERLSLELRKGALEYDRPQRELLEDCARRFGDTLKVVYSFGLLAQLKEETAWLVSVLENRFLGRGWVDKILETWTIAIQGMVKPPEGGELSNPLIRIRGLVPRFGGTVSAEENNPPADVQKYLDLALRGERRGAAEFALAFLEAGLAPEKIAEDLLVPALEQLVTRPIPVQPVPIS